MKCRNCVNLECDWCDMKADSPDPDMERECHWFVQKTNADRIRSMTGEELADKFEEIQLKTVKAYGNDDLLLKGELKKYWLDWLKQEVGE